MELRSNKFQHRNMAGARSLWRANGMKEKHFGKPVIAIVNSFSQFVPGHVHLHETGQRVKQVIEDQGFFAAEFNTIAIDDGIAMGHEGMLYSLPSRDLIADSVEYVVNAHCADAMICISNCDKITPGMMMAAMRLNIPAIFVSGGPMEAGKFHGGKVDLVDVMVQGASENLNDSELLELEKSACPTCGSCSGMFTANSMNCLAEALGLALPGNGTLLASHPLREKLFEKAAMQIVKNASKFYFDDDTSVLPRNIASRDAFTNAMKLDIAMGGSTNTVLHLLAIANEAEIDFTMRDVDELSRQTPCICKIAPNSRFYMEDLSNAGGVLSIMGELAKRRLLFENLTRVDGLTVAEAIAEHDISTTTASAESRTMALAAPGSLSEGLAMWHDQIDINRETGCIRSVENAYSADGGLAVLYGNIAKNGCIVKTAGVDESVMEFTGSAKVFECQQDACDAILKGVIQAGDVVIIRFEGPKGGPGMQEMLYPTSYLKSMKLDKKCALITDGRFSGGTSGLSVGHVSPEAAAGGEIALIRNNDTIRISIPERSIELLVEEVELQNRRDEENLRGTAAFSPRGRNRIVSTALRMYSQFVSSADQGAVRIIK